MSALQNNSSVNLRAGCRTCRTKSFHFVPKIKILDKTDKTTPTRSPSCADRGWPGHLPGRRQPQEAFATVVRGPTALRSADAHQPCSVACRSATQVRCCEPGPPAPSKHWQTSLASGTRAGSGDPRTTRDLSTPHTKHVKMRRRLQPFSHGFPTVYGPYFHRLNPFSPFFAANNFAARKN
jgi:hypothetical protein